MKMTEGSDTLFGTSERLLHKLRNTKRVVLVASNPNITKKHIRQANITPDCLVFSFNKCRQLHKLPFKTNHCLVHRYGIKDNKFYGYPHKLRVRIFEKLTKSTETFLLDGERDSVRAEGTYHIPMIRNLPLLENYPFDTLPDRGGASSGFYMIALLMALKETLKLDFTVTLLGFTDNGGGRQWYGHAWEFERQATARLNLETIHVFPKKRG